MRLGIIISVAIVLLLGLLILVMTSSSPDGPSRRTSAERLAAATLANLPAVFQPTEESAAANSRYEEAVQYYLSHQTSLQGGKADAAAAAKLADLLIAAMQAGKVTKPLLDDFVPLKPGEAPSFDDALEAIPAAVLSRAEDLRQHGKPEAALEAAQSVWAFGQRLFENSVLLFNRRHGLMMMVAAGDTLFHLKDRLPGGPESLEKWSEQLNRINEQWQGKLEIVNVVRPPIGDLLNVARNDQDLTFRVEATKQMAIAKFNPGHRGNEKAIAAYIAEARTSTEPLIAEAAKAADAFTREELRRIK